MLAPLTHHEAPAFQLESGEQAAVGPAGFDEDLPDGGLGVPGDGTDGRVVDGDLAPGDHADALLGGDPLHHPGGVHGQHPRLGEKTKAGGICTGLREFHTLFLTHHLAEEPVRYLDQQPRAVAGVDLGPHGTAVLEVDQGGDRLIDDPPGPTAVHVHHERDPAGVVFVFRAVQALGGGGRRVHLFASRVDGRTPRSMGRPQSKNLSPPAWK